MGAVPTWHCDPGVARGGHGDLATPCTPCGPWDGVIDSSASGGVKDTGRTRLGEAGRAACVRGGEGDQGAGRGAAQPPGSRRASEAGAGSGARGQGGLRAVTEQGSVPPRSYRRPGECPVRPPFSLTPTTASAQPLTSALCLSQPGLSGSDDVPASHGGRTPGGAQSDMTWSGVTARRERRRPASLVSAGAGRGSQTRGGVTSRLTCLFSCRPSLAGAVGSGAPAGLYPFAFRKEPTQLWPPDLRTLKMTR